MLPPLVTGEPTLPGTCCPHFRSSPPTPHPPPLSISRSNTLFGITGTILLPLCLMKNLASLAPFSLLGIAGMGFTTFAMFVRYIGGTYTAPAGKFFANISPSLTPSFGTAGAMAVFNPQSAILLCMLSTAYLAHYNAPKYFVELKNNTIPRFNKVRNICNMPPPPIHIPNTLPLVASLLALRSPLFAPHPPTRWSPPPSSSPSSSSPP